MVYFMAFASGNSFLYMSGCEIAKVHCFSIML